MTSEERFARLEKSMGAAKSLILNLTAALQVHNLILTKVAEKALTPEELSKLGAQIAGANAIFEKELAAVQEVADLEALWNSKEKDDGGG